MAEGLTRGAVVGERYRLAELIGEGGMGMVWAAENTVTGKPVAIKFLKTSSDELRRRFIREARVASALRHPNIIDVHDVIELDGGLAMIMDLLDGEPLSARLDREGALGLTETAEIMLPVLSAVGMAHARGIVHRDLKPENIFLCRPTAHGSSRVRVLDFGIAKVTAVEGNMVHTGKLTQTGSVLGTPTYMAPEQVYGEKGVDHRADIWTLGIILYECLHGACPVQGENVGQVFKTITQNRIVPLKKARPELPEALTDLVAGMLDPELATRIDSVRDVAHVLADVVGVPPPSVEGPALSRRSVSPGQHTPPATVSTVAARTKESKRGWLLGVGAVALVGLGFGLVRVLGGDSTAGSEPVDVQTTAVASPPVTPALASVVSADAAGDAAPSPVTSAVAPVQRPVTVSAKSASPRAAPRASSSPAPASAPSTPTDKSTPGGVYEVSPY